MRGPKPKPAAVRDQTKPVRSARKAPAAVVVDAAPETTSGVAAPKTMSPEGRKIWDAEAPGFIQARLLGRTDVVAFSRWCETMADWLALREVLKEKGEFYTVESAHGKYIRAHPAAQRMDRLETRLVALEDRFGANPSARQRIIAARAQAPLGGLFDERKSAAAELPTSEPADVVSPQMPATGFLQ